MARNEGIVGFVARQPLVRRSALRRSVAALLVCACAVLAVVPRPYRAEMTITPADPPALSPVPMGGGFGALTNMLGNQAQVEVVMRIAQTPQVASEVSRKLDLPRRLGKTPDQVLVWLSRKVVVRSLRGGMVLFETKLYDPDLARDIIAAWGDAVRARTAVIGRDQTAYKRTALLDLIRNSGDELTRAQGAYDNFRLQSRIASPQTAVGAAASRVPQLQSLLQAKDVEIMGARRFGTDQNMRVQQLMAERAAIEAQLAQARSITPDGTNSVGQTVRVSTEADRLKRELDLARTVYDNYLKYLQSATAEDIAAVSNARVLEPATVDPGRQYNILPILAGVLIAMLALALEFYRLRPPVGTLREERADGQH